MDSEFGIGDLREMVRENGYVWGKELDEFLVLEHRRLGINPVVRLKEEDRKYGKGEDSTTGVYHSIIHQMIRNLSITLNVPEKDISIKATTTDGMGYIGRGEGISAFAVTLLENRL